MRIKTNMDDTFKSKYKYMENVLHKINQTEISLSSAEVKLSNEILRKVLPALVKTLKAKCPLFNAMFKRIFYGGSYYDNLKISKPDEYDLDLVLILPRFIEPEIQNTEQPGFVKIEIKKYHEILNQNNLEKETYIKINNLLDSSNFLSTTKVYNWMQSIVDSSVKEIFPNHIFETIIGGDLMKFDIKLSKKLPAFTLQMRGKEPHNSHLHLDIDLVPCFQFEKWPSTHWGYRANTSNKKKSFLIVPKQPKIFRQYLGRYWRLSFQEQERELISNNNYNTLKPSLKLLKRLRDQQQHSISSYFLKTIYLWKVKEKPKEFWIQSLSVVFMEMLHCYYEHIQNHNIPYFWNENFNLIGCLQTSTIENIAGRLKHIIDDIHANLDNDPSVVAKYLIDNRSYLTLKNNVKLSKKLQKKRLRATATAAMGDADKIIPLYKLGFNYNDLLLLEKTLGEIERKQKMISMYKV